MDARLRRVFEAFPREEVAIIGSATRSVDRANDIDVLFLNSRDFKELSRELGTPYNGWTLNGIHMRRINTRVEDVEKPVQLLWYDRVARFEDHPHCVLLRDGTRLHDGIYWVDPNPHRTKRY